MVTKTKAAGTKPAPARARKAGGSSGPAPAELKGFYHDEGLDPDFGFARFWWDGTGPREGISAKVMAKFRPKPDPDKPEAVTAARTDLLLPSDSQADYADVEHLLERFDAKLPAAEKHAYVQITLRFAGATNIHGPFEEARAFAWNYLVVERRLATILVMHAPFLAGSANPLHAHLISPLRRLGALGWGEMEPWLQNDRGRMEVFQAWTAHRERWRNGGIDGGINDC